jgi:hypothetical protein
MPLMPWWFWYPALTAATLLPIAIRYRERGPAGLVLPLLLTVSWAQMLLNGNAQGFAVAALALVPYTGVLGAVAAATATWVKVFPAVVLVWYLARRAWRPLLAFIATFILLGLIQLPWLGHFFRYTLSPAGGLVAAIPWPNVPWVLAVLAVATTAYVQARRGDGWTAAVILALIAIPRIFVPYFSILLAAPRLLSRPELLLTAPFEGSNSAGPARTGKEEDIPGESRPAGRNPPFDTGQ